MVQAAMFFVRLTLNQLLSLLCAFVVMVGGFSYGPVDARTAPAGALRNITYGELVCTHLAPGQFTDLSQPQAGNGGYIVNATELIDVLGGSYTPRQRYRVDLVGTVDQFKGFVLQARDTRTGNLIGSFTPLDDDKSHVLNCDPSLSTSQATVSHKNSVPVSQQAFLWQSPQQQTNPPSSVSFIYSVAKAHPHYWIRLNATEHRPSPGAIPTHSSQPVDKLHTGKTSCPTGPVDNTTFRLTASLPQGCQRSECSFFLGINTNKQNNQFLDFVVEGKAEAWVAVGFTLTPDMLAADVVGCNRYSPSGKVISIDTWDPSSSRTNTLDSNQSDICQRSSSYADGRISCIFSRSLVGGNPGQDVDLDGEYYFLMGTGNTVAGSSSEGFTYHQHTPVISSTTANPARYSGDVGSIKLRKALSKAHGILMIVAWPWLAGTAMLFAAFLKPVLKKGKWFQVHRALMLLSVLVGAGAFIIIFVAHADSTPPGLMVLTEPSNLAHFIIGIAVMVLQIVNVRLQHQKIHRRYHLTCYRAFRCLFPMRAPGKFRWVFNILHGKTIGYSALLLALVNIGIGIVLFVDLHSVVFDLSTISAGYSIALFLVLSILLIYLPCLWAKIKDYEGQKAGIQAQDEEKKGDDKPIDEDSKFRWGSIVLYLMVTVPLMTSVIVLIAVH